MKNHRLFISWSRPQAEDIAPALKNFIQDVLGIDGIFLSKEIDSGRRWSSEIASALETCDAGLIVVTSENKEAPWLNFEAGAISKRIDDANVIPLLWDISVGEIANTPLNQFQCKSFIRNDIRFVVENLVKLWDLSPESVDRRFDAMWPNFEAQLKQVPNQSSDPAGSPTIEDVFSLIQRLGSRLSDIESTVDSIESDLSFSIYNQSELATASPEEAAKMLFPYIKSHSVSAGQPRNRGLFGSTSASASASASAQNALEALRLRNDVEPAEINALLSAFRKAEQASIDDILGLAGKDGDSKGEPEASGK